MLSNGFDATLHLELKPSKNLFIFRLATHLIALLAVSLPLNIDVYLKVMLYIFILSSLLITVITYLKTRHQLRFFSWRDTNQWIEGKENQNQIWLCQAGAMITSWFVIVNLVSGKNKQSLFISTDQCDKQTYRRMVVRLKYLNTPDQAPEANSMDSS